VRIVTDCQALTVVNLFHFQESSFSQSETGLLFSGDSQGDLEAAESVSSFQS
jgi:hypothetical protein